MAKSVRITANFTGRVQGVGFRFTTQRIAQDFDVAGYVKNLADGSVELVVEGEKDEIREFLAGIDSRMSRNIHNVTTLESDSTDQFTGFRIR